MSDLIAAHGGTLVQRQLTGALRRAALEDAVYYKKIPLDNWSLSDLELIGVGAFSPLTGFVGKKDWESILERMRLVSGEIWTIPVTLPITEEQAQQIALHERVALTGQDGAVYGISWRWRASPVRQDLGGASRVRHHRRGASWGATTSLPSSLLRGWPHLAR